MSGEPITRITYRRLRRLLTLGVMLSGVLGLGLAGLSAAAGSIGAVAAYTKIADNTGGLPANTLQDGDNFGWSVTMVGDLNQDGSPDLAVGAPGDDTRRLDTGAVYLLLMKPDDTVLSYIKIADNTGGFNVALSKEDNFGTAVTAVGDLSQDGVLNLAVGAPNDNKGGSDTGAIYLLSMTAGDSVLSHTKIANNIGDLPAGTLTDNDNFGTAMTAVGDLNQDGVPDLAVGAPGDDNSRGAVYLLLMNPDNTVLSHTKIADDAGGLPAGTLTENDNFGRAMTAVGDLNQDGVPDLAVGTPGDDTRSDQTGAIYLLSLTAGGSVLSHTKIADGLGGLPANTLPALDEFGRSMTAVGDLNKDGVPDLAVGAPFFDDTGGSRRGAVYLLLMKPDNTVLSYTRIADDAGGLPANTLQDNDNFGWSATQVGDLNQDAVPDLAVGAPVDDTGGDSRGAIYILLLKGATLNLAKTVDEAHPRPGQQVIYTLTVTNSGALTATNAVISDPLPDDLTFTGPINLDPPDAGSPGTSPPILVDDLTIAPGGTVAVSFPALVNPTVSTKTLIVNTAVVTGAEAKTPVTATISLTTTDHQIYLPAILKSG